MGEVDLIKLSKKVLERLAIMTYEKVDDERKVNKSACLELNR